MRERRVTAGGDDDEYKIKVCSVVNMSTQSNPLVKVGEYARSDGTKVHEHERQLPGGGGAKTTGGGEQEPEQKKVKQDTPSQPTQQQGHVPVTVTEFLQMDLREMQQAAISAHTRDDPKKAAMVLQDAEQQGDAAPAMDKKALQQIAQKPPPIEEGDKQPNSAAEGQQQEQQQEEPAKPGLNEFVSILKQEYERSPGNDALRALIGHAEKGRYRHGGQFGMECIIPHMHGAGQFTLAQRVKACEFDLERD